MVFSFSFRHIVSSSHDPLLSVTHRGGCWCICSSACWRAGQLHHGKDPDRHSSAPEKQKSASRVMLLLWRALQRFLSAAEGANCTFSYQCGGSGGKWLCLMTETLQWCHCEYCYLKLQGELVGRVFAHFFEVRVEVVQLDRTETRRVSGNMTEFKFRRGKKKIWQFEWTCELPASQFTL